MNTYNANQTSKEKNKFDINLDIFLNKFTQTTDFPTLDAMYYIMERLGKPHQKLKFVHIAGTNGKGSIVEMLNKIILCSKKYIVGKFISPHLLTSNESIQINNKSITPNQVEKYIPIFENIASDYLKETGRCLTRFEVLTSMAILYFFENKCDIVILEVGLGGMYDCTNIVKPIVSAFGNISFDHMAILGNTLEEIALQKAGIIKENSNTVIFEQPALNTIKKVCLEKHNNLVCIKNNDISNYHSDKLFQYFTYKDTKYCINLKGKKQIENAVVVLEIIKILQKENFDIPKEAILSGLKSVYHPARFEILKTNPMFIYDGAHNKDAMINLIETIKENYNSNDKTFIISIIQTKDYKTLINLLLNAFENSTFIFTSGFGSEHKFFSSDTLYDYAISLNSNNILEKEKFDIAIENSLKNLDTNTINFIIGSFYTYQKAKELLNA